jgi:class 3 adenylate cyclase/tetratricopeptide (TPR) repeat protein
MAASITATFVFTDLVDSTATAARLGPEAAEELRQAHFHLLRGAVSASAGAEVKNLGDGLMVVYSSPSRALAGAVGMQQAVDRHNRSGEHPLAVRIGISAGEAVQEDGDYFGDPVTEAARLCAAAQGGQILAAELVRLMVGRHAAQTFIEVGPLALKGIPEPVAAVEVMWEPATVAGSVPLPGQLVGAAANVLFGFFGRGRELAALEQARKRAHGSQRAQLVLVAGEAGVGKTALVAQTARLAHAEGSTVLFGHADEDLGVAYQPWVEVFQALLGYGDADLAEELPAAQRTALGRLLPDRADVGTARVADPEMERLLLLEAAAGVLAATSRQAPVVVVLDDLHWADTASLQLLRHIVASTAPMDAVIACTYRDTDLRRGDPLAKLLADLHREANVGRIDLSGLNDDELVELMEGAAGHVLDDAGVGLAHALRRETDGNPFFTGELLRHLGETGGIVLGDDGRWRVAGELEDLGLPRSVHEVVGNRVQRLGDEALRVLRLAAVIGREFDLSLLTTLADIGEDAALDLVDAAVAAAVLVESSTVDHYEFAHALIQHTLYEELSPGRRQRAHQRVAEALESGGADDDPGLVAELARHWIAATHPADVDKAVRYARRAGDLARDALAPDDAIRWYRQALDLVERQARPDLRQRASLLAALGTVQRQIAHPDYHDALVQAATLAEQLDDPDVLVAAALGFQLDVTTNDGNDDARRVLDAALAGIGPEPTPTRARLLAELALSFEATNWQVRRELSTDAIDVARRAGEEATFAWVLAATQHPVDTPDRLDQQLADVEAAAAIADRSGDPALQFRASTGMLWAAYQRADLARADAALADLHRLADTIGLPGPRWQLAQYQVGRLILAGNVNEAEAANERLLELATATGAPEAFQAYGGLLIGIRQYQGRVDEVVELLITAARDRPALPALRSAIPSYLCDLGRTEEAREWFAADAANRFDYPYNNAWLPAMVNMTDTAAALGDRQASRALIERLAPFSDHVVTAGPTRVYGALARPLARAAAALGEYDQAEAWFATAHDIHARLEAPYLTARGQLDEADFHMTRDADGDVVRARDVATTAAATAAHYGCAALSERAAGLLATI